MEIHGDHPLLLRYFGGCEDGSCPYVELFSIFTTPVDGGFSVEDFFFVLSGAASWAFVSVFTPPSVFEKLLGDLVVGEHVEQLQESTPLSVTFSGTSVWVHGHRNTPVTFCSNKYKFPKVLLRFYKAPLVH